MTENWSYLDGKRSTVSEYIKRGYGVTIGVYLALLTIQGITLLLIGAAIGALLLVGIALPDPSVLQDLGKMLAKAILA